MLYLDALPRVPDVVDVGLHLVQVTLEPLLVFLIGELDIFEAFRQFCFLLLLTLGEPVVLIAF